MGSGYSFLGAIQSSHPYPQLDDLPENCIALILANLDAVEICKLAKLSRVIRWASMADFVWESKLPGNYEFLARKVFDESAERVSKREIYAGLCRPVRFDGGTKEVWLEKRSGKMCMEISWKCLKITGIDDRRHWIPFSTDESRFHTIAYLQQVWWLEVEGALDFNFPAASYSLFFRLQLGKPLKRHGRTTYNINHVHGWDVKPVRFQFSASTGQNALSQCYLSDSGNWVCQHVGDFTVENPELPVIVKFSMAQIDCTHTKGGLCLDSVLICPTEFAESSRHSEDLCSCW